MIIMKLFTPLGYLVFSSRRLIKIYHNVNIAQISINLNMGAGELA